MTQLSVAEEDNIEMIRKVLEECMRAQETVEKRTADTCFSNKWN